MKKTVVLGVALASLLAQSAAARTPKSGDGGTEQKSYSPEFGIHTGPLLPSHVPGAREILPMWGGRFGILTDKGMIELELSHARSEGVTYNSAALDYRLDIHHPLLPIPAHFLIGAHMDHYKGRGSNEYLQAAGWHYGGGLQIPLAEPAWFRFDFKYRFSPGKSLYVGVSVVLRFPESSGGSD